MTLPSLPSSPTALFRCYLIPSKRTRTRTSVRGAFNLYFIAVGTSVFQSVILCSCFLQPQGLDNPSVVAQIRGLFCPDFKQWSVYSGITAVFPRKRNRKVFSLWPTASRTSLVWCSWISVNPFVVIAVFIWSILFRWLTGAQNAMTLEPRWCFSSHRVCLCCQGSSYICDLVWCLFLSL